MPKHGLLQDSATALGAAEQYILALGKVLYGRLPELNR